MEHKRNTKQHDLAFVKPGSLSLKNFIDNMGLANIETINVRLQTRSHCFLSGFDNPPLTPPRRGIGKAKFEDPNPSNARATSIKRYAKRKLN